MKKILMFPLHMLSFIFGSINWYAPPWIKRLDLLRKRKPLVFWGGMSTLVLLFIAYLYFETLPKPITVMANIRDLNITANHENAKPDYLDLEFNYDFSALKDDQERPDGEPSVARIDLVGKEILNAIKLYPAKSGKWHWIDDRRIRFKPEHDWAPGIQYKLKFDKSIFAPETKLSDDSYQFITPAFMVDIDRTEFYQDPQDIAVRRVISTIKFSHPVEKSSFEKKLSMSMRPSNSVKNDEPNIYNFDVSYDKNLREAYIQSEPVTLPSEPNYMKLNVNTGVKSLLGGNASEINVQEKVLIPDIYNFLKVDTVHAQVIRNNENEPQQVITLEFTDDIDKQELLNKLDVYLLPEKDQSNRRKVWNVAGEVDEQTLRNSKKIDLEMLPNERNFSRFYNFVVDVPENRFIYLHITSRLTSVNKFVHASFYNTILISPVYPKEVNIAGEGAILTHSGDHKLNILSRGVPALKYSIGRLRENQLYHFITQTNGDITRPSFHGWNFSAENISEFNDRVVDINSRHSKDANYSSFDLTTFLPKNNNRFGLFFIDVRGWNRTKNREIYGAHDKRLILITDLGIIVKNNVDKTLNVFVQSIQTGLPVAGAKVELLGKNGVALYAKTTSSDGHVAFPSTRDFKKEKQPTVYVVKTTTDISFIPFNRKSRQINLSKYEIGGVDSRHHTNNTLNAYAFSDRGIYRPGEHVSVGFIVKNFDFSNVEAIPLEVVVRGPRNNVVKVEKLTLAEKGFFDFKYLTESTSDTGSYRVSLHLVRANERRGRQIGSVEFKVEEFQPDTMRIESRLVDVSNKGWSNKNKINVNTSLKNLFGIPAQDRNMKGRLIVTPSNFSFKEFEDYKFADQSVYKNKNLLRIDKMLPVQKTDKDGIAHFELDLSGFSEGTYGLQFIVEGFDQAGGRSVIASNKAFVSPFGHLIGYKANGNLDYIYADSKRNIEFIAIDTQLKKVDKTDLTIKLFEVQTISTLVKQNNGTYKYQRVKKENQLSSNALNIKTQGHSFTIDTSTAGDYILEIYDPKNKRLSKVEYSVVGHSNPTATLEKNTELQLKLNKSDYLPGDLIEMNIKAPYAGAGLISIETDKVHHFKWFKTDSENTLQHIRIPEELEGSAYVNVAFVRNVGSKEIFTSPLSYAVQPFSIDKSKRKIDVSLNVKDIVRPGKPMEITYSASKQSKIAIFAVDEGILQVAEYKTPDPLGHFLKKRSLGVDTLQMLDLILPEYDLIKELSASGGGVNARSTNALAKNLNPFSRKVDKPAVYWSGIVDAGPDNQTVVFDVPNTFAGELRVMAVAVGDESVGVAIDRAVVRGPFVILANVLTHAAPEDEFFVTVGITNIIKGSGEKAKVDVQVKSSEHLDILGEPSTELIIDEGDEAKYTFKVKAKNKVGLAKLNITARHKSEESIRTVGLSVRPAMPYQTSLTSGFENDGNIELSSNRHLYPNLAKQSVFASTSPLVLVDGLMSYLESFPHGCTEQMVSQVFPLVGLMAHPAYAAHVQNIQTHFSHVIGKLRERQLSDGGFSFWPGIMNVADYPTIYAMHFLIESRELGYPVPEDLITRGQDYLTAYVSRPATSLLEARLRANAIYLLTRLGVVTTNYLVDLEEYLETQHNKKWSEDLVSSYMAATYKLLQKNENAFKLIAGFTLHDKKRKPLNDFDSNLAQDAQHILLMSKHFESEVKTLSKDDILTLSTKIFKGEYNTLSSAYIILALSAYSQLTQNDRLNDKNISFSSYSVNGQEKALKPVLKPFLSAEYTFDTQKIKLAAEKPFFYLNVQSGFNIDLPTKSVNNGIEIYREFINDEGNSVTSFEQGEQVTVRLKVRALNNKNLSNIAVVDLLPGGFEVIRSSVFRTIYDWSADYLDIREDRVVYYGSFDHRVRELTYKVKVTAAGEFIIPPAYAQSMYDRSVRSVSSAGKLHVIAEK